MQVELCQNKIDQVLSVIHVLSYNLSYIPGVMKTGSANLKVVWYPTIWWFSWKIQFLDNTRFKTFEHLSKTFWNDFAKFSSRWVWNLSKVHSGISFFYIATAICGVSPENSLDDRNGKTKTNNNTETNNDWIHASLPTIPQHTTVNYNS